MEIFVISLLLFVSLFALLCFFLAPRRGHRDWTFLRQFRYAHRGLHRQPLSAADYPADPAVPDVPPRWETDVQAAAEPVLPENSLAAFRRAASAGFGAELDVHLTKDARLAVVHDSELARVTGRAGTVEDLTSEELDTYRLLGTDEHIPYLEEVLPIFEASGTPLVVELKTYGANYPELTGTVVACLDRFQTHYCIESFDPRVLLWLRQKRPEIVRGQLATNFIKEPNGLKPLQRIVLTNLLLNFKTRPDFIAYEFGERRRPAVRLCCGLLGGQEVNWTIRSPADLTQAEHEGHLAIFERFVPDATRGAGATPSVAVAVK
ncbi:MAG: glycerophosphodiester phosphodiesterase family protein [Oscillospiraceae bacterium]|jgi:glycerophosphoryl diester phosphodiesterase